MLHETKGGDSRFRKQPLIHLAQAKKTVAQTIHHRKNDKTHPNVCQAEHLGQFQAKDLCAAFKDGRFGQDTMSNEAFVNVKVVKGLGLK